MLSLRHTSTLRISLARLYSSGSGSDFLDGMLKGYKEPAKKRSSSDILKSATSGKLRSSTGRGQPSIDFTAMISKKPSNPSVIAKKLPLQSSQPQSQHQSASTQRHQKPKPKDQDVYTNFDPLTSKYKESPSVRENEFYTEKLKQIFAINPRFDVMAIGGDKSPEKMKLKTFISRLGEDEAFDVVDVQQLNDTQYPMVRPMNKQATLKTYSDKKAVELTKMFGRTRDKKRESNVKFIKVSWEISQTDLENQKTNEIMSQLKKGYKLTIAVDTKENLQNSRYTFDDVNPSTQKGDLHNLEQIRRERAFEYIKALLEANGTIDFSGSTKSKIIINVTPNAPTEKKTSTKKTPKDEKKNDRAAKQKRREEEKRAQLEAKSKQFEETIAKLE